MLIKWQLFIFSLAYHSLNKLTLKLHPKFSKGQPSPALWGIHRFSSQWPHPHLFQVEILTCFPYFFSSWPWSICFKKGEEVGGVCLPARSLIPSVRSIYFLVQPWLSHLLQPFPCADLGREPCSSPTFRMPASGHSKAARAVGRPRTWGPTDLCLPGPGNSSGSVPPSPACLLGVDHGASSVGSTGTRCVKSLPPSVLGT